MSLTVSKNLRISSPAFNSGENIPVRYTCSGEDISPRLIWNGAPAGTRSYALLVDDPDAPGGTFTHWIMFNIPPDTTELPENVPRKGTLEGGMLQGKNSGGKLGYMGPCPPRGSTHRYIFHLYALDMDLDMKSGITRNDLMRAVQGHILDEAQIMGLYGR